MCKILCIQEALSSACERQRDRHFDIIVLNSTYLIHVATFHKYNYTSTLFTSHSYILQQEYKPLHNIYTQFYIHNATYHIQTQIFIFKLRYK